VQLKLRQSIDQQNSNGTETGTEMSELKTHRQTGPGKWERNARHR